MTEPSAPASDCSLCPRLAEFRHSNQQKFPAFFNAPVPSFGSLDASLLVVGLAPGLKGANQTGRPFTGDYAGKVLYPTLLEHGFATGSFDERTDDGLTLQDCRITNAVRCVPPENKPTPQEMKTCRPFLLDELRAMPNLQVLLCLGRISHISTSVALGYKQSHFAFGHGAEHTVRLPDGRDVMLIDSYHCSRYNIQTNRLSFEMFSEIVGRIRSQLNLPLQESSPHHVRTA